MFKIAVIIIGTTAVTLLLCAFELCSAREM